MYVHQLRDTLIGADRIFSAEANLILFFNVLIRANTHHADLIDFVPEQECCFERSPLSTPLQALETNRNRRCNPWHVHVRVYRVTSRLEYNLSNNLFEMRNCTGLGCQSVEPVISFGCIRVEGADVE